MRQCELWVDNTDYDHQEGILYHDFANVDETQVAEDDKIKKQ